MDCHQSNGPDIFDCNLYILHSNGNTILNNSNNFNNNQNSDNLNNKDQAKHIFLIEKTNKHYRNSQFNENSYNTITDDEKEVELKKEESINSNNSSSNGTNNNLIKSFKCYYQNCEKVYKTKKCLKVHIKSHLLLNNFQCQYEGCNKIYKSRENLNLHIKNIHNLEKPYKCSYCDSKFSHRNGNILFKFLQFFIFLGKKYHERIFHTREMPFKCSKENCLRSFASKSSFNYHVNFQHNKKKEKKVIKEMIKFLKK